MNDKLCTKCQILQPEINFNMDRGYRISRCKLCISICNKLWREKNKKKIKIKNKKIWKIRKNDKKYLEKMKNYYIDNLETILNKKREYYKKNKQKILNCHREYERKKLKSCPLFRLQKNIRRRMHLALKGRFKNDTTINIVGCTWEKLVKHLELNFKNGMTWNNYGYYGWHVDHIVPLSSFDLNNPIELKKAMHYTNLQPLWMNENLKKRDNFL